MTDETPAPEKPKRTFRMLQPTKDTIRAELAQVRELNALLLVENERLRKPWWARMFGPKK